MAQLKTWSNRNGDPGRSGSLHRKCNLCQVVPVNDDVAVAVDGVAVAVDNVVAFFTSPAGHWELRKWTQGRGKAGVRTRGGHQM